MTHIARNGLANRLGWVSNWYWENDSDERCGMYQRVVWLCLLGMVFVATSCGEATDGPDEFADLWFQSFAEGDVETYRETFADDAVFVGPEGESFLVFEDHPWLGVDDFDGDGAVSFSDHQQATLALASVTNLSWEWDCTTVTQDQAECTITAINAFVDAGGGPPIVEVLRLTVEDGKIAILVKAEPVDSAATETLRSEMRHYASWVQDQYPNRYDTMFHGPCCSSPMIELPDSIAQHIELIKEYFETIG